MYYVVNNVRSLCNVILFTCIQSCMHHTYLSIQLVVLNCCCLYLLLSRVTCTLLRWTISRFFCLFCCCGPVYLVFFGRDMYYCGIIATVSRVVFVYVTYIPHIDTVGRVVSVYVRYVPHIDRYSTSCGICLYEVCTSHRYSRSCGICLC
jgi:hypothetical protein